MPVSIRETCKDWLIQRLKQIKIANGYNIDLADDQIKKGIRDKKELVPAESPYVWVVSGDETKFKELQQACQSDFEVLLFCFFWDEEGEPDPKLSLLIEDIIKVFGELGLDRPDDVLNSGWIRIVTDDTWVIPWAACRILISNDLLRMK